MRIVSIIILSVASTYCAYGYSITPSARKSDVTIRASICAEPSPLSALRSSTGVHVLDRKSFLVSAAAMLAALGSVPGVANAGYGESTSLALPNYIDYLIEKNKSIDPSDFLYKGADPETLLKRLLVADTKLAEIPALSDDKKWSQVQGVLTGPLGNFAETLNLISKQGGPEVQAAGKKIKSDLINIGQAAAKKEGQGCAAGAKQASADLEAFVKAAFQ